MSNVGRPVGPLPTAVYWRRRILALVAIAAVAVLVRAVLSGDDESVSTTEGSSTAGVSPTPKPSPPAAIAAPSTAPTTTALEGGCDPADVAVELDADVEPFATGLAPVFTVTTRNDGATACGVDVGPGQLEVVVSEGDTVVWSSDACEGGGVARVVQLDPAQADVTEVGWPAQFAASEECPGQSPAAAGAYTALATVSGVASDPVDVQLDD